MRLVEGSEAAVPRRSSTEHRLEERYACLKLEYKRALKLRDKAKARRDALFREYSSRMEFSGDHQVQLAELSSISDLARGPSMQTESCDMAPEADDLSALRVRIQSRHSALGKLKQQAEDLEKQRSRQDSMHASELESLRTRVLRMDSELQSISVTHSERLNRYREGRTRLKAVREDVEHASSTIHAASEAMQVAILKKLSKVSVDDELEARVRRGLQTHLLSSGSELSRSGAAGLVEQLLRHDLLAQTAVEHSDQRQPSAREDGGCRTQGSVLESELRLSRPDNSAATLRTSPSARAKDLYSALLSPGGGAHRDYVIVRDTPPGRRVVRRSRRARSARSTKNTRASSVARGYSPIPRGLSPRMHCSSLQTARDTEGYLARLARLDTLIEQRFLLQTKLQEALGRRRLGAASSMAVDLLRDRIARKTLDIQSASRDLSGPSPGPPSGHSSGPL